MIKIVEIASAPKKVRLRVQADQLQEIDIAGFDQTFTAKQSGCWEIDVPSMRGGYRQFLFFKYAQHQPRDYKILTVKQYGQPIEELSLRDIEQLPTDEKGYSLLQL